MDMDYQTWIMPSRAKSLSCRREKMLFAGLSYGPVVKTSLAGVIVSVPDQGAKITFLWPKIQSMKQKQYCDKFNKDFKSGHIKKICLKIRFFKNFFDALLF